MSHASILTKKYLFVSPASGLHVHGRRGKFIERNTLPFVFLGIWACIIFLAFIFLSAERVESSYLASKLRDEGAALKEEREQLEVELARVRSLESIEIQAPGLGLERIDRIGYVSLKGEAFALEP